MGLGLIKFKTHIKVQPFAPINPLVAKNNMQKNEVDLY